MGPDRTPNDLSPEGARALAKALVIAEKPSVARDIAAVLGDFTDHDGYFENDRYIVTFAVGHLFELLPPEEVDDKYKRWTLDALPILPEEYRYRPKKGQSERIKHHPRAARSAGRRGRGDQRLRRRSRGRADLPRDRRAPEFRQADPAALAAVDDRQTRFATDSTHLRPGEELEGLADAAACRARSDWLIGMNATRAFTKRLKSRKEKTAWSAGRVQTPTLAMLVEREHEILAHVPRPYWRVSGNRSSSTAIPTRGPGSTRPSRRAKTRLLKDDRIFEERESERDRRRR